MAGAPTTASTNTASTTMTGYASMPRGATSGGGTVAPTTGQLWPRGTVT